MFAENFREIGSPLINVRELGSAFVCGTSTRVRPIPNVQPRDRATSRTRETTGETRCQAGVIDHRCRVKIVIGVANVIREVHMSELRIQDC